MDCPKCKVEMVLGARVWAGNVITEQTYYCPKCKYRHVERKHAKTLAVLLMVGALLTAGCWPSSENYGLIIFSDARPVVQIDDAAGG